MADDDYARCGACRKVHEVVDMKRCSHCKALACADDAARCDGCATTFCRASCWDMLFECTACKHVYCAECLKRARVKGTCANNRGCAGRVIDMPSLAVLDGGTDDEV